MPGGTFGGISFLVWGYIAPKCGSEGRMAITDTEIMRAKPHQRSYSMSDSGRAALNDFASGAASFGVGSTALRAKKADGPGKMPPSPLGNGPGAPQRGRRLLATGVDPIAQRKAKKTAELLSCENSLAL
jgi:hypothetical protein